MKVLWGSSPPTCPRKGPPVTWQAETCRHTVSKMRIPINLASEPFRKDRPMVAASSALAVVLAGLLVVMGYLILSERTRMRETRREIARLSDQADKLSREQAQLDGILRQPANAEVLERSLLLNALVDRKSISWTRIFADLESRAAL